MGWNAIIPKLRIVGEAKNKVMPITASLKQ